MNVCTCPAPEMLHQYLLGTLDLADEESLDEHLETCAACQLAIDAADGQANAVFACLRDTPTPPTEPDDPALRRLVSRAMALGGSTETTAAQHANGFDTLPPVLGNYVLLELLGAGGMGRVYKAQHQRMKRTVALKVLGPQLVRSPSARARFQREIEAVARLSSPHIVAAFDAGEADGHDFLVMEYVPGQTLADRVRHCGPLPIATALDFTLQAARGLAHAHHAGIIHRDVKPSNLLEAANPQAGNAANPQAGNVVKVLDLGLARLRTDDAGLDLTGSDAPMGTTHFMAPEQAENPHGVDERADVYGLGCTLFFLLTGRPPYEGHSAMEVLMAHRTKPLPSVIAARPGCPAVVDALVRRLIAKRPQDRPASMNTVVAELEQFCRAPDGAIARRRRRWPLPAAALIAASVLLSVGMWPFLTAGFPQGDARPKPAPLVAVGGVPGDAPPKRGNETPPAEAKNAAITMVRIPAGEFWMGASDSERNVQKDEMPRRKIKIKLPFDMGKTEITQAQYEAAMGENPSAFGPKGRFAKLVGKDTGSLPVESITWLDAVRFCNRLSERHGVSPFYKIGERVTINGGRGYRLPTEAEWEYACRGGAETTWYFGEKEADLGEHAWFAANSHDVTHPVGLKKANPFGLYDMYGNVPEWCWDQYDDRYFDKVGATDPVSASDSPFRVFRGGAWNSLPGQLRTAARNPLGMAYGAPGSNHLVGMRVVRNVE